MHNAYKHLFLCFFLAGAGSAHAVDKIWSPSGSSGNWSNGANWTPSGIPAAADVAVFDTNPANVTIDQSVTIAGIHMKAAYSGTITQAAGSALTVTGTNGFNQVSGNFLGSDAPITVSEFSLSAGTFRSTSGLFTVKDDFRILGNPTFNANGGVLKMMYATSFSGYVFDPGANNPTFNKVIFDVQPIADGRSVNLNINKGFTTSADLVFLNNVSGNPADAFNITTPQSPAPIIEVGGHLLIPGSPESSGNTRIVIQALEFNLKGATSRFQMDYPQTTFAAGLRLSGSANQTFAVSAGTYEGALKVDKASGKATLLTPFSTLATFKGEPSLQILAGILDINGQNLTYRNSVGINPFEGPASSYPFTNNGTLMMRGDETLAFFLNDINSGTIEIYGGLSGSIDKFNGEFFSLTLSGSGSVWTRSKALDINGSLNLLAGQLVSAPSAANLPFTVAGNWSAKGGQFVPNGTTVTIDGAQGSISKIEGSNTFYGFVSVIPSKTLEFEAGQTTTILKKVNLQGNNASQQIHLVSSKPQASLPEAYWYLKFLGDEQTLRALDVNHSNADGGFKMVTDPETSDLGSANTNWFKQTLGSRIWVAPSSPGPWYWSDPANWGIEQGGVGGFPVPGPTDSVTFGADGTSSGNGDVTIDVPVTVKNLTFNRSYPGVVTVQPGKDITVSDSFVQSNGTINLSAMKLSVGGDFSHTGGRFEAGQSTVVFVGNSFSGRTPQVLGETSFHTLVMEDSSRQFQAGTTFYVTGKLVVGSSEGGGPFQGGGSARLTSTVSNKPWHFKVTAPYSQIFVYGATVEDSDASSGNYLIGRSVNSGSAVRSRNWFLGEATSNRYWVGKGSEGLWSDPLNWSVVEGWTAGPGASVPTDQNDVFFTAANGVNALVDQHAIMRSFTMDGYTGVVRSVNKDITVKIRTVSAGPPNFNTTHESFKQTSGTLSLGAMQMNIFGDLNRTGGAFLAGTSTVSFVVGQDSNLIGSTTFYRFVSDGSSNKTLNFQAGATFYVMSGGKLVLRNTTLHSTVNNTTWYFAVKAGDRGNISSVRVKDSNARVGGQGLSLAAGDIASVDEGNNDNWFFQSRALQLYWVSTGDTKWSNPFNWALDPSNPPNPQTNPIGNIPGLQTSVFFTTWSAVNCVYDPGDKNPHIQSMSMINYQGTVDFSNGLDIEIDGSLNKNAGDLLLGNSTMTVLNDVTINPEGTSLATSEIHVKKNLTITGPGLNAGLSKFVLDGPAHQILDTGGSRLFDLTIDKNSFGGPGMPGMPGMPGGPNTSFPEGVTLAAPLAIDGSFSLDGFFFTADHPIEIVGNWSVENNNTIVPNTSVVTFTGPAGSVSTIRNGKFWDFKSVTGKILQFESGLFQPSVIEILNSIEVRNATLKSTQDGSAWLINFSGEEQTFANVKVADSNANNGNVLIADRASTELRGANTSNNSNWVFANFPPSEVRDLTGYTESQIALTWNAPTGGVPNVYEFWASRNPITPSNVEGTAELVSILKIGSPKRGASYSYSIPGLTPGQQYYVAVRGRHFVDGPPGPVGAQQIVGPIVAGVFHKRGFDAGLVTDLSNPQLRSADYDRDGFTDFAVIGATSTRSGLRVYRWNVSEDKYREVFSKLAEGGNAQVEWVDANSDGRIDLVFTTAQESHLLLNDHLANPTTPFVDQPTAPFEKFSGGAFTAGDMNNDGHVDLAVTGKPSASATAILNILKWSPNGYQTLPVNELTSVNLGNASTAWGDTDRDGDLDLLIAGGVSNGGNLFILKNNGDGTLSLNDGTTFSPGLTDASAAWGDYNNDGWLDFAAMGRVEAINKIFVYTNNKTTGFEFDRADLTIKNIEDASIGLSVGTGAGGSLAWGDLDNDGALDLAIMGQEPDAVVFMQGFPIVTPGAPRLVVFTNNGSNPASWSYIEPLGAPQLNQVRGLMRGSLAFARTSATGDADFLVSGMDGSVDANNSPKLYLFRNQRHRTQTNTPPAAPDLASLSVLTDGPLTMIWNAPSDNKTAAPGIMYEVQVSSLPFSTPALSTWSVSGVHGNPFMGNYFNTARYADDEQKRSVAVNLTPDNFYYWRVRSIDASFATSPFTEYPERVYLPFESPMPVTDLVGETGTQVTLSWTAPSGFRHSEGPVDHYEIYYSLSEDPDTTMHPPLMLSDEWTRANMPIPVANPGQPQQVTVTGLVPGLSYWFAVIPFNEKAHSGVGSTVRIKAGQFEFDEMMISTNTPALLSGSVVWGDLNNDTFLDFVLCGSTSTGAVAQVHLYDSTEQRFRLEQNLSPTLQACQITLADLNNDDRLDIAMRGQRPGVSNQNLLYVYQSGPAGGPLFNAGLPLLLPFDPGSSGDLKAVDLNNDGAIDLSITGASEGLYGIINGLNEPSQPRFQPVFLATVTRSLAAGGMAWADVDNNGVADLAVISGTKLSILKNSGGTLTLMWDTTVGSGGGLAWGDMNNDGFWDLAVSGNDSNAPIRVYKGNGSFVLDPDFVAVSTGGYASILQPGVLSWGDLDNDGWSDLVTAGIDRSQSPVFLTLKNDNGAGFTLGEQPFGPIGGLRTGSLQLGDYDRDGDVDMVYTGVRSRTNTSFQNVTQVLRNARKDAGVTVTAPPAAPTDLSTEIDRETGMTLFKWRRPTSGSAPQGYTYNLKITNTDTSAIVLAPRYGAPQMGNIMVRTSGEVATAGLVLPDNSNFTWEVSAINQALGEGASASKTLLSENIAPAAVTDLVAVGGNQVHLTWTATGDNGRAGRPSAYLIYYSPNQFVTGGDPGVKVKLVQSELVTGGRTEHREIDGLIPGQRYYFKIQAQDLKGNGSEISNEASAVASHFSAIALNSLDIAEGSIAIGDISADGKLDAVLTGVSSAGNRVLTVIKGNGTGAFATTSIGNGGGRAGDVALTDLDRDNTLDLLASGNTVSLVDGATFYSKPGLVASPPMSALPPMSEGQFAVGDINNDGSLDVVVVGKGIEGVALFVNKNSSSGFGYEQRKLHDLTLTSGASVALGDVDGDGRLDIAASGLDTAGYSRLIVLRQQPDGNFTVLAEPFGIDDGFRNSTLAFADFNLDGKLDLVGTGIQKDNKAHLAILEGTGREDAFVVHMATIGVASSNSGRSLAIGDFTNDGLTDVAIMGEESNVPRFVVYLNNGSLPAGDLKWETEEPLGPRGGLRKSSLAAGDIDADGFLDLMAMGETNANKRLVYFIRNSTLTAQSTVNAAPAAPTLLAPEIDGSSVTVKWFMPGSDADRVGMTYDLAIDYTDKTDSTQKVLQSRAPAVPLSGRIVRVGANSAAAPLSAILQLRDNARYSISIRAIDSGKKAGQYSGAVTVDLNNVKPSNITDFVALPSAQIELRWTAPGGDGLAGKVQRYEIKRSLNPIDPANVAAFENLPDRVANIPVPQNYGAKELLMVTGLTARTHYYFGIRGYDGTGGETAISTASAIAGNLFLAQVSSAALNGALALGDYDGNGRIDALLAGDNAIQVWQNNGLEFNSTAVTALPGVTQASIVALDYNHDARLDFVVSGNRAGSKTMFYTGTGGAATPFQLNAAFSLPGATEGSMASADVDRDGDMDIAIVGNGHDGIYLLRNKARETPATPFVREKIYALQMAFGTSLAWTDVNNDAIPDLTVAGTSAGAASGTLYFLVFLGTPTGGFEAPQSVSQNVQFRESAHAWVDLDSDGLKDLVITGHSLSSPQTRYLLNKSVGTQLTFVENTFPASGVASGGNRTASIAGADLDNDGRSDIVVAGKDVDGVGRLIIYFNRLPNDWIVSEPLGPNTGFTSVQVAAADTAQRGAADVIIAGTKNNVASLYVLKNVLQASQPNDAPNKPTLSSGAPDNNKIRIEWTPAGDPGGVGQATPSKAMNYEIQIRRSELANSQFSIFQSSVTGSWDPLESTCRHASLSIL